MAAAIDLTGIDTKQLGMTDSLLYMLIKCCNSSSSNTTPPPDTLPTLVSIDTNIAQTELNTRITYDAITNLINVIQETNRSKGVYFGTDNFIELESMVEANYENALDEFESNAVGDGKQLTNVELTKMLGQNKYRFKFCYTYSTPVTPTT